MLDYKKIAEDGKSPLISVIVPVYNAELYLIKCIDSIRNQTYRNLEIILINDGSTDKSGQMCDHLSLQDSRISVIHQQNGGSSIARNEGLKIAKGDFISFIDSDDWIELDMLEHMISSALKTNLKVIECASIESTQINIKKEIDIKCKIESREKALERIVEYHHFSVWRRIYHISLVKDMFFIPYKIHQDVFYTIDLFDKIEEIGYIDYPFYIYNTENTSSIIRGKYTLQKLNAIDAGLYVVNKTYKYNEKIKISAKKYLIKFLTYHYNALYLNNNLDSEFIHRKEIKCLVTKHLQLDNFTLYGFLVSVLPFWSYRIFLNINKFRISKKIQLLKAINNVKGN